MSLFTHWTHNKSVLIIVTGAENDVMKIADKSQVSWPLCSFLCSLKQVFFTLQCLSLLICETGMTVALVILRILENILFKSYWKLQCTMQKSSEIIGIGNGAIYVEF